MASARLQTKLGGLGAALYPRASRRESTQREALSTREFEAPPPVQSSDLGNAPAYLGHSFAALSMGESRQPRRGAMAPIQRQLLITTKKVADSPVTADDVGFEQVKLHVYAEKLADDGQVVVKGESNNRKNKAAFQEAVNKIKSQILEAEVTEEVARDFALRAFRDEGLWGALSELPDKWEGAMRDEFLEDNGEDAYSWWEFSAEPPPAFEMIRALHKPVTLIKKLANLEGGTVEDVCESATIPLGAAWQRLFGDNLYERARFNFYTEGKVNYHDLCVSSAQALAADINNGFVGRLLFSSKWETGSGGAEFEVTGPSGMKAKHSNKSVVHTHYNKVDEEPSGQPIYGHTKPETDILGKGYGGRLGTPYFIQQGSLLAVDDTQRTFEALA